MRLCLGLMLSLAQAACTSSGAFVCSIDGECSGGTCEANGFCSFSDASCASGRRYGSFAGNGLGEVCVGEEPDAGPSVDGTIADAMVTPDGGSTAGCGSTDLLVDDFADGLRGYEWGFSFDNGGATASEQGGRLVIDVADTGGNFYAGYATTLAYDLRGHAISVEVVTVPNAATSAQGVMSLGHPKNDAGASIEVAGGMLNFIRTDTSGNGVSQGTLAFSATDHRYWRIREAGGQVFWETSPDRTTWTLREQASAPIDFRYARVSLFGGTYEAAAVNPGEMVFDNLNTGVPASEFCAPETLVDRFDDGVISDAWSRDSVTNGCVISEGGGVLRLTPAATAGSGCQLASSTAYDLRGKAFVVRVAQMVDTSTQVQAYLRLADFAAGSDHYVGFFQRGGQLLAQSRAGGAETDVAVTWNATDHAWWRIREASGMVIWETSPDGTAWSMRRMSAAPVSLTRIVVDLSVENGAGAATPGAAHFDDFNAPP
jgi:hypothetical protein